MAWILPIPLRSKCSCSKCGAIMVDTDDCVYWVADRQRNMCVPHHRGCGHDCSYFWEDPLTDRIEEALEELRDVQRQAEQTQQTVDELCSEFKEVWGFKYQSPST